MTREPGPRSGAPAPGATQHTLADYLVWLAIALLGCVATGIVIAATASRGAGLLADSACYVSAARNLAAGKGLIAYDGYPLVSWAPLYSVLLAGLRALGIDPLVGARFLNAFAAGLSVVLAGLLFLRTLRSRLLAVTGAAAMIAPPILWLSTMLLSEAVFFALAMGFMLALVLLLQKGRPVWFGLTCCMAALLGLQRYIGGVSAIVAAVMILVWLPRRRFGHRLLYAAGFAVLALLPLGLWLWRNYRLTGLLAGFERVHAAPPFGRNALEVIGQLPRFLTPHGLEGWVVTAVALAALAALVLLRLARMRGRPDRPGLACIAALVFCLVYLTGLVFAITPGAYDQVYRFATPLYPLLVLLILAGWEALADVAASRLRRPRVRTVLCALFALWLAVPATGMAQVVPLWKSGRLGAYNSDAWFYSDFLAWLRDNRLEGTVFSNDPAAVYLLGNHPSKMTPRPAWGINRAETKSGTWIAWFWCVRRPYLYSIEDLSAQLRLEEVFSFPDGSLYVVP